MMAPSSLMKPNKLAIIQARMSSSRLPGKVMSEVAGRPMLKYMLERVRNARLIDGVLLATTTDPSDDVLEKWCQGQALPCYRGSLHDVLDRYFQAATQYQAEVIIRLTADCPLIDPEILDLTVNLFLGNTRSLATLDPSQSLIDQSPGAPSFDFAANRLPPPWKRSLPIGLDVEVCSLDALERAWKEARERYQREHVMPYLYEGVTFAGSEPSLRPGWYRQQGITPRGFRVALLNHEPDYGSLRWTVDTPEDLEFIRAIAERFEGRTGFGWQEVLDLLEREPELSLINQKVKHKSAFDVDRRSHIP